ncbi:MAG TPA: hypothetical protein VMB05_15045 [Solirubrobacteraceae bacterium]|nr:hypothetical protein [Solirubrobacteraceae bacterium]
MMTTRGIKVALGTVAAILAVVPTSPALAVKNLVLTEEEGTKTAAPGSRAEVVFTLGEQCYLISVGTVVTNGAPKDVLTGTTTTQAQCPFSSTKISGLITETVLSSKGTGNLTGSITLTPSESCSYVFKNPKSDIEIPGWILFGGTTTGKLVKGSSKSCAPEDVERFVVSAFGGPFGEALFEDTLA